MGFYISLIPPMPVWENRRILILQALALGTLAFLKVGQLLNEARDNADFSKLHHETWDLYMDDIGLEPSRASRLMAVARFVEEHQLDTEFTRSAGETRLYLAYRGFELKKMTEEDLPQLPEKGTLELRHILGYKEGELKVFVCGQCGADWACPRCGATKVKRIAPTQKEKDA